MDTTTTTIRVELTNNSTARDTARVAQIAGVGSRAVRHNGGKVAVITCGADESDAVCDRLATSHAVRTYEVVR